MRLNWRETDDIVKVTLGAHPDRLALWIVNNSQFENMGPRCASVIGCAVHPS